MNDIGQLREDNRRLMQSLGELREAFTANTYKLGWLAHSIGSHGDASLDELKAEVAKITQLREAAKALWLAVGTRMIKDEDKLTYEDFAELLKAWKAVGEIVDPATKRKEGRHG